MLATGLLILKIIGLILLGILGFLLALILLVLLVPIRYRAEGSYYGEAKAEAAVSWLLHIISCKVVYDGELDVGIRVFGFRAGDKNRGGGHEAEEETAPDAAPPETPAPPESPAKQQKKLEAEILKELEEERQEELRQEREQKKGAKGVTSSAPGKKRGPHLKMPFSFQGICDKLKQMGQQKDQAEEFLKNEENKKTFRLLFKQVKSLLKHILPRKMRGKVKFGFDDPYTTGQVLMYISPFYGLYGKKFQVIPVFEEPVLEGEAWLKGRIRIGIILVVAIRVLLDKNFRTLLKKWRE